MEQSKKQTTTETALHFANVLQEQLSHTGAVLFSPKEPPRALTPSNGTDFKLTELYKLIECHLVELVHIDGVSEMMGEEYIMIIDEEGKLRADVQDSFNLIPSILAFPNGFANKGAVKDWVAGKAIVCRSSMFK